MKTWHAGLIVALALVAGVVAAFAYLSRDDSSRAVTPASLEAAGRLQAIEASLEALNSKLDAIARSLTMPATGEAGSRAVNGSREEGLETLLDRLGALERSVNGLKEAVEQLRPPSTRPTAEDLASAQGYLHADDFYARGEYGQAAKAYETFLEHHGEHPEARKLLEKLREAYTKTGDPEKAIAAQEELLRKDPGANGYDDYMLLARMKRDLGRVEEAVVHAEQAIGKAADVGALVGGHMTRAWFVEERDGAEAGLAAYRETERFLLDQGWTDSPFLEPCRKNISRIEEIVATRRGGK